MLRQAVHLACRDAEILRDLSSPNEIHAAREPGQHPAQELSSLDTDLFPGG